MAKVIGAELQLEAVGRYLPLGRNHHASVVDEQVEAIPLFGQPLGECRDRDEIGKIELLEPDLG